MAWALAALHPALSSRAKVRIPAVVAASSFAPASVTSKGRVAISRRGPSTFDPEAIGDVVMTGNFVAYRRHGHPFGFHHLPDQSVVHVELKPQGGRRNQQAQQRGPPHCQRAGPPRTRVAPGSASSCSSWRRSCMGCSLQVTQQFVALPPHNVSIQVKICLSTGRVMRTPKL